METFASNPGGVRLDWRHFLKCERGLLPMAVLIALFGLGVVVTPWFSPKADARICWAGGPILLMSGPFVLWVRISIIRRYMMDGNTCPAVIVDADKQWIAVWTDLSTSPAHEVPAIKISQWPLRRGTNRTLQVGDRLSTVAMYEGSGAQGRWDDFGAYPVILVTAEEERIRNSLVSIPKSEWQALESGLQQLPRPLKQGLHLLNGKK